MRRRSTNFEKSWWDTDKNSPECADAVFGKIRELRNLQRLQILDMAISLYQYHGPACAKLLGTVGLPELVGPTGWTRRTPQIHNITAWGIDTVAALISLNKPKGMFLTNKGNYQQQRRAKKLTDFCQAVAMQNNLYSLAADIILDGLVLGNGIVKIYMGEDGRIKYGRVLKPNLTIDEDEGLERNPRQMFERHLVTREQVIGLWPDKRNEIEKVPSAQLDDLFGSPRRFALSRNIEVVEAWRLPEGKAVKGRHVICVANTVLVDEPWNWSTFPFAFFTWKQPRIGFWGISLAQELRPMQVSVNMLNDYIMETIRRVSRARIWLPQQAKVAVTQLDNGLASAYTYSGLRPPIIDNSDAVPQEMISERNEKLTSWAPSAGVGPDAAAGSMPANLRSGEAQKVHLQFQNERLNMVQDFYSYDFHMTVVRKTVETVRHHLEMSGEKSYKVKLRRGNELRELDFKDADLPDSDVELQLSPINFFSETPEAKIDQIVDFGQNSLMDKTRMLYGIAEYPDVKRLINPSIAPLEFAYWVVEQLVDGEDVQVDETTPIDLCVQEVKAALLDLMRTGADEDTLDRLNLFLRTCVAEQANRLQAAQAGAAQAAQATSPMGPGGADGAATPPSPIAAPPVPPQGDLQAFAGK